MTTRIEGRARRADDAAPIWVASIDYHGQILRWAAGDVPWSCLDDDGRAISWVGSWSAPASIDLADDVEVSVELVFPPGVNVAATELEGVAPLAGCTAEVAWMPRGGDWQDRYVVARGRVTEPEGGADGEPVMFGLVPDTSGSDLTQVPHETHVIGEGWTTAPEASFGLYCPHVYGRPGWYRVGDQTYRAGGSPAVVVRTTTTTSGDETVVLADTLLIADTVPPNVDQVRLRWQRASGVWVSRTKTIVPLRDPYNREVATLDISLFADDDRKAGSYTVSWEYGAASGTESASEVVRAWLETSSMRVDLAGSQLGLRALAPFRLGGYVNQPTSPKEWIADRLSIFPVRMVDGPHGAALVPIRWDAQASDAIAHIAVTRPTSEPGGKGGALRVGPVRSEGGEVTEVRLSWAMDCSSGSYKMLTVLGADGTPRSSRTWAGDPVPSVTDGTKVVTHELPDVWDDGTAALLTRFIAWQAGAVQRTVQVAVPTDGHAHLVVGDVVTYSDEALGGATLVALVDAVWLATAPMMELRLRLV